MRKGRYLLIALSLAVGANQVVAATAAEAHAAGIFASQALSQMGANALSASSATSVGQAMAGSPAPSGGPIQAGSELTLKQAISIAIQYHPRLKEMNSLAGAAEERVGEARSLLGPQIFGVSQYLRSTDNGIGNTSYYDAGGMFPRMTGRNHDLAANSFAQSWDTGNNYMNGLAVSQFLFDFGRHRGFVAQRSFEAKAAGQNARMSALGLILEVSQRYFGLLRAMQLVRVYRKAIEQRQFHLREAQVKASAGLRPQLDVYVTEAEVERAKLHLVDARNAQADAKVALDNAMGLSEMAPNYKPASVLTYSPIKDHLSQLVATAFRLRPDLKMFEDQARAMGAEVTEYRSDYYPTVSALGGYAGMNTDLPVHNNFNVGILITWPIFNSFLTTDQIEEAKMRRESIQHAIEDLRQHIILQVETAFLDWKASLQRIRRAEKTLAASRAELELAEKRYEAGLASIVELEDAQRHYTFDDAAYADALYRYSVAKATVDQATGRALANL